jgi:UDP-2-acetamido-2-deoxy-ribo-hexuluronate aminotransferase
MEFIDLKAQFAALGSAIQARIQAVLEHGNFIMGPEVRALEKQLATYCGVSDVVSCANGTDALCLALRGLGIGPGDVVITTPFTFFATAEAIELVGARTAFADIDPVTYNLDPARVTEVIQRLRRSGVGRVRAVIAVDLFGLPADYAALERICREAELDLVEDAAQGFGGVSGGRAAGAFGRVATTSFFPAKPLGCYGDGGALLTNDAALAARLRSLRVHGQGQDKYDNVSIGTNSRLDTLQAAVLLEKLRAFPGELEARQRVARRYAELLPASLVKPKVPTGCTSSWAQYSVLARDGAERRMLMDGLREAGVPTAVYYARPLHLQTALAHLGHVAGDFPISEDVSSRVFSLPMHPYLDIAEQDAIVACLERLLTKS